MNEFARGLFSLAKRIFEGEHDVKKHFEKIIDEIDCQKIWL
jgi:hypothetical protein